MPVAIDEKKCSGCGICILACPESNAIKKNASKKFAVNPMLCKACLLCASVCPKKAIDSEGL